MKGFKGLVATSQESGCIEAVFSGGHGGGAPLLFHDKGQSVDQCGCSHFLVLGDLGGAEQELRYSKHQRK